MDHLLPCFGCNRHVRAAEAVCPFCGEALPLSLRRRVPLLPVRRLGRAATLAFGAALAVSACSDSHGRGQDDGGATAETGAGDVDAGPHDDDAGAPNDDAGSGADVDAGVIEDAGTGGPDAGRPRGQRDGGGIIALYGGPPMPD